MLNEAMNYCQRRGWPYRITWTIGDQWYFEVGGGNNENQARLQHHLDEWEKND